MPHTTARGWSPSCDFTYVKSGDTVRVESKSTIENDSIIARNGMIAEGLYNEWPISADVVLKNYGAVELGYDFTAHQKTATVQCIELTRQVMAQLGVEGDTLDITVDWSAEPMVAHLGDYHTSGRYSISAHDMLSYERVEGM